MNFKDKCILITGATAGIGREMLNEFISCGARRIAVIARSKDKLDGLKLEYPNTEILPLPGDVSNPDELNKAIETIKSTWGQLDILVNNAGVVSAGALEDLSDEDIINQVSINLTGPILLTKKCLGLLKQSPEGAIINVSSGLGYIAWPFYNVYAATKAGIRQFSDALTRDLYEYPIHVMTIYPTATNTPMMENAVVANMDDPKMVAKRSIEGLINKERNVIFGGEQRLIDIELNFNDPEAIDAKAIDRYEALRQRTKHHRAM